MTDQQSAYFLRRKAEIPGEKFRERLRKARVITPVRHDAKEARETTHVEWITCYPRTR